MEHTVRSPLLQARIALVRHPRPGKHCIGKQGESMVAALAPGRKSRRVWIGCQLALRHGSARAECSAWADD